MEITIKGEANEIAALVVAIQERRGDKVTTPDAVRQAYREALKNCGPASIGNRAISASITPELIAMKEAEARMEHGWVTVQGAGSVVSSQK